MLRLLGGAAGGGEGRRGEGRGKGEDYTHTLLGREQQGAQRNRVVCAPTEDGEQFLWFRYLVPAVSCQIESESSGSFLRLLENCK